MKAIFKDGKYCSACKKAQLTSVVLSLQIKPTKNFVPFFELELGGATYTRINTVSKQLIYA